MEENMIIWYFNFVKERLFKIYFEIYLDYVKYWKWEIVFFKKSLIMGVNYYLVLF